MDEDIENFYIKFQMMHRDKYLDNKVKLDESKSFANFK